MPNIHESTPVPGMYPEDLRGKEGQEQNPWSALEEMADQMPSYSIDQQGNYHYRQAEAMNRFSALEKKARSSGDDKKADYYHSFMVNTLENNPVTISDEDLQTLDDQNKLKFYRMARMQADILGDEDGSKKYSELSADLSKAISEANQAPAEPDTASETPEQALDEKPDSEISHSFDNFLQTHASELANDSDALDSYRSFSDLLTAIDASDKDSYYELTQDKKDQILDSYAQVLSMTQQHDKTDRQILTSDYLSAIKETDAGKKSMNFLKDEYLARKAGRITPREFYKIHPTGTGALLESENASVLFYYDENLGGQKIVSGIYQNSLEAFQRKNNDALSNKPDLLEKFKNFVQYASIVDAGHYGKDAIAGYMAQSNESDPYSLIQSLIDSPDTPPEDKQLATEFLGSLDYDDRSNRHLMDDLKSLYSEAHSETSTEKDGASAEQLSNYYRTISNLKSEINDSMRRGNINSNEVTEMCRSLASICTEASNYLASLRNTEYNSNAVNELSDAIAEGEKLARKTFRTLGDLDEMATGLNF